MLNNAISCISVKGIVHQNIKKRLACNKQAPFSSEKTNMLVDFDV